MDAFAQEIGYITIFVVILFVLAVFVDKFYYKSPRFIFREVVMVMLQLILIGWFLGVGVMIIMVIGSKFL